MTSFYDEAELIRSTPKSIDQIGAFLGECMRVIMLPTATKKRLEDAHRRLGDQGWVVQRVRAQGATHALLPTVPGRKGILLLPPPAIPTKKLPLKCQPPKPRRVPVRVAPEVFEAILREYQRPSLEELCAKHGVKLGTFNAWRRGQKETLTENPNNAGV